MEDGVELLDQKQASNNTSTVVQPEFRKELLLNWSKENQKSVWTKIDELRKKSDFTRTPEDVAEANLEVNNQRYSIQALKNPLSPDLDNVHQLLVETFSAEEVDPIEVFRANIAGKTPWGTESPNKTGVFVIKNEQGEIVNTAVTTQLELINKEGKPTGKTVLFVYYVVTRKGLRQSGFAREAYVSVLIEASLEAESNGKQLLFMAGDSVPTAEPYLNSIGRKRVYAKRNNQDNIFDELDFVLPALDFDKKTGEVADNAGEVPEHLMVERLDKHTPTKDEITQIAIAFYRANRWPKQAFHEDIAYENHERYVISIEQRLYQFLLSHGQLIFLDKTNREKARRSGLTINDINDEHHRSTGPEDS